MFSLALYSTVYRKKTTHRSLLTNSYVRHLKALGGINENNIRKIKDYGFGGAAVLGDLWNKFSPEYDYNYRELIEHFRKLKHLAD